MWTNAQFPVDFFTFTKETLNGKLHFLCSVDEKSQSQQAYKNHLDVWN